ncbi:MAG: T9SS type A sorting domain-containing protein [Flavobacteriales bacterium]|nr:MAG: T9SS type A sorting domain-containing protein [Flavobacteriales bacterium]
MRVRSTLFVCLCLSSTVGAQNLIPNPGFEDHSGCAGGVDWQSLDDWINPGSQPEYLHACNNPLDPSVGVPGNLLGYQFSHSGDGHIAVSTYLRNLGPNHPYATAHLNTPLTAGTDYCVRIWINLLEASEVITHHLHGLFTDTIPSTWQEADTAWAADAQVIFNTASVDTANWTALDAVYTAAGGEEYFTFGNFLADSLSTITNITPPHYRCTFVVDDVWVGSCDVSVADEQAAPVLSIYPNPASEFVTVSSASQLVNAQLRVFDIHGQVVLSDHVAGTNCRISVAHLPAGTYYVRLQDGETSNTLTFSKSAP